MPPIRTENQRKSIEQEGRILLAISDFQNQKISSIRQAARIYNVPYTTLSRRLHGISIRDQKRANCHKLSEFEEESIIKWILDLDKRGLPPRPALVRDMTNYLCSQWNKPAVGINWVYKLGL